jgi:integrase
MLSYLQLAMHSSNTSKRKSDKGSVQIKVSNNRLQLVFRYAGKRYYLSTGFADTTVNRKMAEQKAKTIELDIISGNFDPTLTKYKPQSVLTTEHLDITPTVTPIGSELWRQYREYKASSLKETTKLHHEALAKLLDKTPPIPITDALKIKTELEKVTTIHQTKRILTQLGAVCKWAKKHGLLDANPYEGMANDMPKYRYQLEPKPNSFTEEEREQVIEAFRRHKGNWNGRGYTGFSYAHYASFVEFLFLTGCRPSEAIGLQWKQVSEDCGFISFKGAISYCYGKKVRVEGSKNNKERVFPCSSRLRLLLESIKPDNCDVESFVFPSRLSALI